MLRNVLSPEESGLTAPLIRVLLAQADSFETETMQPGTHLGTALAPLSDNLLRANPAQNFLKLPGSRGAALQPPLSLLQIECTVLKVHSCNR